MHLENLRLVVTDADLNALAFRFQPQIDKVRDISVAIVPEGIHVRGIYDAALAIPFDALWEVLVWEGNLAARLGRLKTGFLSLGLVRSYVVSAVAGTAKAIGRHGDMLLLDVDALLAAQGVPLQTNLSSIQCHRGSLVIEARAVI
jgi:hypothetical protein